MRARLKMKVRKDQNNPNESTPNREPVGGGQAGRSVELKAAATAEHLAELADFANQTIEDGYVGGELRELGDRGLMPNLKDVPLDVNVVAVLTQEDLKSDVVSFRDDARNRYYTRGGGLWVESAGRPGQQMQPVADVYLAKQMVYGTLGAGLNLDVVRLVP